MRCAPGGWATGSTSRFHGRGVATAAVALIVAHGFGPVGLHRIEATIAPENLASRAVVAHLGFRQEGHLVRYLDIDGAWRDHLLYALTVEEVPRGLPQLLQRWQTRRRRARAAPADTRAGQGVDDQGKPGVCPYRVQPLAVVSVILTNRSVVARTCDLSEGSTPK